MAINYRRRITSRRCGEGIYIFEEEKMKNEILHKQEALEEMDKRLDILKEDSWAMELIAGELMEERAEIQTEIAPKLAALQNLEYKLSDICNRKGQLLVQYRMSITVRENLKTQEDPAESMEVV